MHGIADRKQRAPITRFPTRDQRPQQFKLLEGGVLKFIDQQMSDASPTAQRQIGGRAVLGQRTARRRRHGRKVDLTLLGKFKLQLGGRVSQQHRERRERSRILRRNRRLW